MSNTAYKHLESKLKIAELTLTQWAGVVLGVGFAIAWGMHLSPFGTYVTLFTAIYLGGVPVLISFLASQTEFDLWLRLRSLASWRRGEDRFAPGPAAPTAQGYVLTPTPLDPRERAGAALAELDVAALWD